MIKKPFVGQKVRFNDLGLKQCFGSAPERSGPGCSPHH